jgi:hypothetical protein
MERILSELASALETTGGLSRSFGSERMACETLSPTSLAASSSGISRLNSTLIELVPWLLLLVMLRMPGTLLIAFSSG